MMRAANLGVLAYGLMLAVVGLAGIFTVRFELPSVFHVDLAQVHDRATFASQYGFLKGLELGAGAFCLLLRREILMGGAAASAFLILISGGIAARSFAWLTSGPPSPAFIAFLGLEALVLILFLLRNLG